ncbi:hypothetical protein BB559_000083 [Furculomyces boomerangus]|uniref:2-amino-3-carboxymuconate-6-semialdehyde decarboxylase n=2 Tax=Harpellales TaxID=61421 RepID=A0A2T9Z6E3_9FUNG|nr:hypothetical protein BB559_000083 [Furculomyces boomerangus]PWA00636.1 hypothetical protein BB558_003313 [Smittium angustum]
MTKKDLSQNRFKVDLHTHILPKEIPDFESMFGYGGWVKLENHETDDDKVHMYKDNKHFRTIACNCWSPEKRMEESDDTGVDVQVISTIPVMFSYWAKPNDALVVSEFLNNHVAKCVTENPKRFIGLGTIPMQSPDLAIKELKRCVNELGLSGVQIGSHVNNLNLDDPQFEPLWKAAEELDTVIFVHPWDMDTSSRMSKYWFPWLIGMPTETTVSICSMIFGGVFERYPNLKVCFAHGGGSFLGTFGRICHGYDCRPDIVATGCKIHPSEFISKLYFDSLVHDENALKLMVDSVGTNKILLGSDYPFPLGEQEPGKLVEKCEWLTEDQKRDILGLNALKLFKLDIDRFL